MTDQEMMEDAVVRGVMTMPELVAALDGTRLLRHVMGKGHDLGWVLDRLVVLTRAGFSIQDASKELALFVSGGGRQTMQGMIVSRMLHALSG